MKVPAKKRSAAAKNEARWALAFVAPTMLGLIVLLAQGDVEFFPLGVHGEVRHVVIIRKTDPAHDAVLVIGGLGALYRPPFSSTVYQ